MEYPTINQQLRGQVTGDEGIVYDVSVRLLKDRVEGPYLEIDAEYNPNATADQYDSIAEVYGTGPVTEEYHEKVPVIGSFDLRNKKLDQYFDMVQDHNT